MFFQIYNKKTITLSLNVFFFKKYINNLIIFSFEFYFIINNN